MVAFGQSFINVCINTREHRELLGWLLGLPLGLGSLLLLRSGAQAISHAKCTSSNVDTAETACSLYYYIFSWPGCPTSQPVTASNPYLTANQSIPWSVDSCLHFPLYLVMICFVSALLPQDFVCTEVVGNPGPVAIQANLTTLYTLMY